MAPVSNIEDTFNLKMYPKPTNLNLLHSVDIFPTTTTYDHHLREGERSLSAGKEPAIRSNNLRCYRTLFPWCSVGGYIELLAERVHFILTPC